MARASNLTAMCSFCGKSHVDVQKLIAGRGVYICDGCINVCNGILDRELIKDAERQFALRVPRLADIWRTLKQYVIGVYRVCLEWFQEHVLDKVPFLRSADTEHEEERMPSTVLFTLRNQTRYRVEISLGSYQCLISNATVAKQMQGFGFHDVSVSGFGRNRTAEATWLQDDATIKIESIEGKIETKSESSCKGNSGHPKCRQLATNL
jgi:hypothetical protein